MKTLQNNFTTPEQSKRLLELGVLADSADFYFDRDEIEIDEAVQPYFIPFNRKFSNYDERFYIPCWSVGRLIEIYEICFGGYFNSRYFGNTLMKDVLLKIEEQIDIMDFSKLDGGEAVMKHCDIPTDWELARELFQNHKSGKQEEDKYSATCYENGFVNGVFAAYKYFTNKAKE